MNRQKIPALEDGFFCLVPTQPRVWFHPKPGFGLRRCGNSVGIEGIDFNADDRRVGLYFIAVLFWKAEGTMDSTPSEQRHAWRCRYRRLTRCGRIASTIMARGQPPSRAARRRTRNPQPAPEKAAHRRFFRHHLCFLRDVFYTKACLS